MPEELHQHRSQRPKSPFLLFLRTYWGEILIVVGLVLAVFLLFEQMNIRATLVGWFSAVTGAGLHAAGRLFRTLVGVRSRLGLSELVAIPMLIGLLILLGWRVRSRLRNMPELVDTHCPHCGGRLHRIHRHFLDRAISILVPVRRYRCSNRDCGWTGVRVSAHSGRSRANPASQ